MTTLQKVVLILNIIFIILNFILLFLIHRDTTFTRLTIENTILEVVEE